MIMQLGAIFSQLLEAGIGVGTQFLNRELSRDSRRQQRDLIKAQAQATGSGSFVQASNPGTVAPPFTIPIGFGGALPPRLPGPMAPFPLTSQEVFQLPARNGVSTGTFGGGVPAGMGNKFVFDKRLGQVRLPAPGEKPTHRVDPRTGDFVRIKARRMNPLNFSAFKRADRRRSALLSIVKTLFREDRKEKAGSVAPRKRRTKRKKC